MSSYLPPIEPEILRFIELFESDENDLVCESSHTRCTCSVEVTHRILWCKAPLLLCTNAANANVSGLKRNMKCRGCQRSVLDCWKVIPI